MKKFYTIVAIAVMSICTLQAQNYNFLGNYTADGTPLYLENPGDIVSQDTQNLVSRSLPEGYPVPDYNPHYISSGYDTDIIIDAFAEVFVTYVNEGAGYKNVLGFYTYDVNNPPTSGPQPEDITIIFPNVSNVGSGGGLSPGDKVKLGDFPAGTGIGWVLLANGWNGSVTQGHWQLYSNPNFNPEADPNLRYHNVLLNDPTNQRVILGFEDIRRDYGSCDNDFNDALFYVTANPYTAMRTANYADVSSAANITSANDGGLESNGDLASLVAKRNFNRTKFANAANKKSAQTIFNKDKASSYKTSNTAANPFNVSIVDYLPGTGMYGTETAYVSSPTDLLGITNAVDVFSLDMYSGADRVSAVLATESTGNVYDHTKMICDRLNSSSLEDVRTVMVRGYELISAKILRAGGEVEYTLSFSVKLGQSANEIHSYWNIDQYPAGDYFNFQIWGSSFSQVFSIANHVIDTFTAEKPLNGTTVTDRVPTVFVRSGFYANGVVNLNIINKSASTAMSFTGNIADTELADSYQVTQSVALTGNWYDSVSITTGTLFDIGFSLAVNECTQQDALYLADGPWGVDYLSDNATLDYFDIAAPMLTYNPQIHEIEREPTVSGMAMGTVNVFRHTLPGDQTLDVSGYSAIQFTMTTSTPVEVILMQEGLTDWNDRYRYTIPATTSATDYGIAFTDFVDGNGNSANITDVKTLVFSINGNYTTYVPYDMSIESVAFGNNVALALEEVAVEEVPSVINYPNPFKGSTTIRLVNQAASVDIQVVDMLGRTVDVQTIKQVFNKEVTYKANHLKRGMYKYIIKDDTNAEYTGTFMVK
ncbi:DUF4114 domain-containing protein [Neptunitalea lumnitzerae]|uniref:DUF4114 domain-containing protein n=1 Tax=Neptunitalea lumnitzerae TaxID=2965509 RepID=A0ABQ5MF74_9FLAO|nr:DUF4114 domain-containing protein [Neptunitalea sp. Y10]GLB48061.1 hypothetical protein Y10_04290 [Neptunitalea sp. Y10]